ncbi:MAG: hypothetical protein LUE29_02820 [Lachnospiraceae bacterium]|nr:hypothetical protein [Lachnospiraceae bacterium]
MNNLHIKRITAVTEVFPDGQKCTGVELSYDCIFKEEMVTREDFEVQNRTVLSASVRPGKGEGGCTVYLALSPDDRDAATYLPPGPPSEGGMAHVIPARVRVAQIHNLTAEDGSRIPEAPCDENDAVRNFLVDEFIQGEFEGLAYNLFVPRNYDAAKKYPLVQFIHDASVCSDEVLCTLAQGVGALVWMTEEAQAKQECFVLAPQFAPPTIVEDNGWVDERLETEKRLLDKIVRDYSIDPSRLYTTGQSMGCMSSMVLNLRYPNLFAASFFVAGQWDERQFRGSGLQNKNFWFLNSQGDAKAFPGMNQILVVLEREGAKVAREVWRADEFQETYRKKLEKLAATGANMIYTPYEITTVADGWHSGGGEHHVTTWKHAYGIEAVREWMFSKKL